MEEPVVADKWAGVVAYGWLAGGAYSPVIGPAKVCGPRLEDLLHARPSDVPAIIEQHLREEDERALQRLAEPPPPERPPGVKPAISGLLVVKP